MRLYRTPTGAIVEDHNHFHPVNDRWDDLIRRDDLPAFLSEQIAHANPTSEPDASTLLAPVESQEVWAAGVTYYRSLNARVEESKEAGGGNFYDRVYSAPRPELFFKSPPHRVVGPGGPVRIRRDSKWNVPEPELALVISAGARIVGYTIGNDMSSRDIEGENPLYLPQAKMYDGACALGPAILVTDESLPKSARISLRVERAGAVCFEGSTTLAQMKRSPEELVEYLYRETRFEHGCILLTGTGVIPPNDFTLAPQDRIDIEIDAIGTLSNVVA